MRIVFAGTPDFAVPALKSLAAHGHDITAVLTQPDRPSGRGRRVSVSPVKDCALALGLRVLQPQRLADREVLAALRQLEPEVIVVAAYGLILPSAVLDMPPHGCLNVHASLLPRWRGAAPVQRAIAAGDRESGVSIMQMTRGLDTGPVLAQRSTPITARDTGGSLHDRLALLGAELLTEVLVRLGEGAVEAVPQDDAAATYAAKLSTDDALVHWDRRADEIERMVRAMNPWPVARSRHRGNLIRIWSCSVVEGGAGSPGEVLGAAADGIDVACGRGILRLNELQREGGRRLRAAAFVNGYPLQAGETFDRHPG